MRDKEVVDVIAPPGWGCKPLPCTHFWSAPGTSLTTAFMHNPMVPQGRVRWDYDVICIRSITTPHFLSLLFGNLLVCQSAKTGISMVPEIAAISDYPIHRTNRLGNEDEAPCLRALLLGWDLYQGLPVWTSVHYIPLVTTAPLLI